jgi:hypothetical protein
MIRRYFASILLLVLPLSLAAQEKSVNPGINKSFEDPNVGEFVDRFERDGREPFDHRDKILDALGLKPGMAVADIGAGTGLFTRLFAARVGKEGRVYAVDIARSFVDHVEMTSREAGLTNVVGVVCEADDAKLPPHSAAERPVHHLRRPEQLPRLLRRSAAKTPNIDKLAARGVRFDRAYCTFPLCGPSRNSMLTGLYPNSTASWPTRRFSGRRFPRTSACRRRSGSAGYFAARIGKLYHYNVPKSIGTNGHDDPGSWELELNPAGVRPLEEEPHIFTLTPGQFGGTLSWYASPKSDEHHTDGMMAADAEWVLERCARQKDRPFFLAVGFFRPHTPYVAPQEPVLRLYPEARDAVVRA